MTIFFQIQSSNITASEAIRRLNEVKQFAEVHGDNDLNMALNDLTGRFEALKLHKLKQSDISNPLKPVKALLVRFIYDVQNIVMY